MPDGQRRLAAIVAADIAGYSRLMGADEEGAIAALRGHRSEVIDPKLSQFHGRVANTAGDSLLIEFPSAVDALRCAMKIQRDIAVRCESVPEDRRLLFRIGINVGDVVAEGDDLLGDGVNVAARLEGLAEPGGICISRTARDQVRDRMDIDLEDLGEIEVKNIARPVRVFKVQGQGQPASDVPRSTVSVPKYVAVAVVVALLVGGGAFWWQQRPDFEPADRAKMVLALPDKPSVAVLPFNNISSDREQDYFADGMVEDLITDLSKVSGLFVIARNSTFTYKGKAVKVQRVAEDLGVRFVVEGSVRRAGEKVRINVQLVDALSGHHVWAERYDGVMADIFDLQDRITGKVVAALAVKLTTAEASTTSARPETAHPAAYDAVLKGWNYLHLRRSDPANYVLAKAQFEKALALDPDYNRGHLSMAAVYWWASIGAQSRRLGVAFQEGIDRAKGYLATAMKSPTPLAHRIASEMLRWEGQHDKAVEEAERAIALDPNNPEGYGAMASALVFSGQAKLALEHLDKADRLEPENERPNWIRRGIANFLLGNYEKAAEQLALAVARDPEYQWNYRWLIATYGHLGKIVEGLAAIEKIDELRNKEGRTNLTLQEADGSQLKRAEDRERLREGWNFAGVPAGVSAQDTKIAWDTLLSRSDSGGWVVKGVPTIGAAEAKRLLDNGGAIIDSRGPGSRSGGYVKGSLYTGGSGESMDEASLAEIVKKDQAVAFYCGGFT